MVTKIKKAMLILKTNFFSVSIDALIPSSCIIGATIFIFTVVFLRKFEITALSRILFTLSLLVMIYLPSSIMIIRKDYPRIKAKGNEEKEKIIVFIGWFMIIFSTIIAVISNIRLFI